MVTYVFLVAAVVAVVFSLVTIAHRNPVVNVLSLAIVFFALSAIYAVVGMDFLAAIQLIVYSGAVLVLFLFVIMLLNIRSVERLGSGRPLQAALGAAAAIAVGVAIVLVIGKQAPTFGSLLPGTGKGTAFAIGRSLMTTHLFPFEFISVLLLAALIGALVLARKEER
ncbi:MAG: NADH-quinone oxidoreductase subunit J [Acidobacteria bacterium]|nr:NADH-quinone oxidoreductase subunit J [Acidobacteriota bacterium]